MDEREQSPPASDPPDFQAVFETADAGIQVTDTGGRFLAANRAMQEFLGYDAATLAGMAAEDIVHPDDRAGYMAQFRQFAREAEQAERAARRLEVRLLRSSGRTAWVGVRLTAARNHDGTRLVVGTIEDLSERRRLEQQLRYRTQHDDLTGMRNRFGLQEQLQHLLHVAPAIGHPAGAPPEFVLLFVGVGRLREIGAAFGSRVRDGVIQQVATRLRGVLDSGDQIARFDEHTFAVIMHGVQAETAVRVAGRVLDALRAPFDVENQSLDINVSIGAAVFPEHGHERVEREGATGQAAARSRTLIRHAEIALQTAWVAPSCIAIFDEEQERLSRRRADMASNLRRAIQNGELVLHYQPKVDVQTGATTGVEALVRWNHPEYGLVLPDDFVPLAEESGVIKPLTRWVLGEALRQAHDWRAEGIDLPVVVNLSARILHDHYVVEMATDALTHGAISPGELGLEVTESAVMLDPSRALVALHRLHDLGVAISLDDFGTGYSSFAYLDQLPATELKIDRSFVRDMVENPSHHRIVHGTIDIGHDLGLATVAEGIEDAQTLEALAGLGCDLGQGFYLSPPLPGDELAQWVQARR